MANSDPGTTDLDTSTTAAAERSAVAGQVLSTSTGAAAGLPPGAHSHGGPSRPPGDARPERKTSRDPEAFGVPTGREEDWRFTPLDRLRGLLEPISSDGKVLADVQAPE